MAMDSLTPPTRAQLGISNRGFAFSFGVMPLGSAAIALYLLVVNTDTSSAVTDCVIWSAQAPGAKWVCVTIMSFFYSCFITVVLLELTVPQLFFEVDLVIIDGPVVFSNCF